MLDDAAALVLSDIATTYDDTCATERFHAIYVAAIR